MTVTVAELCDVVSSPESPEHYTSTHQTVSFAIVKGRAYGGNILAIAISAACRSVNDPAYELYSCVGHFLDPARSKAKLQCRVERLRTSRGFITCRVLVSQMVETAKEGQNAIVVSLEADFHRKETRVMPPFSTSPKQNWPRPEELPHLTEHYEQIVAKNGLSPKVAKDPFVLFKNYWDYIETRDCPDGVGAQNLNGQAKRLPTTQDHLPITEKVTADWIRAAQKLSTESKDHYAAVAFALDMAIAYMSLLHDHKYMDDIGVIASLDFTLRFFDVPDMNEWVLREQQTVVGGKGRSFDECRLFNREGRLIASMTQQSLIRPQKESKM